MPKVPDMLPELTILLCGLASLRDNFVFCRDVEKPSDPTIVAQAVKPAEPRLDSSRLFFSFPEDSSPSATTNESRINFGVDFLSMGGRQAPVCHLAFSTAAKPTKCGTSFCLDGTDISTQPVLGRSSETTAHRA